MAVKKRKTEEIDLLIEFGLDINPKHAKVQGPLSVACEEGDIGMVEFLLERGADPNVRAPGLRYPLYNACTTGNVALLQRLLDHGADSSVDGGEPFAQAIWGGKQMLDRLLQQLTSAQDRERYLDRALQEAAYYAKLDICTWLLDAHGANLNYRGGMFGSPLQAALSCQRYERGAEVNNRRLVVGMLLDRGADVNPRPVPNPRYGSKPAAPEYFASPLTLALERSSDLGRTILAAGADANLLGGEYHSPLQAAARLRTSMLEPLLAAGADVNAMGGYKFGTALHAAAYAHNLDAVRLLLAHAADVHVMAGKYGSALQAAAKRDSISSGSWTAGHASLAVMKALVAAGADVHVQGGRYGSVLQMAAKSGNLEAVRWLLEDMGTDVEVRGGKFGGVQEAALVKERWGVVSYLEMRYGQFVEGVGYP